MKGTGVKTDNHPQARRAKIAIRQNVLAAIGSNVAVFDAFAGSGEMFSAIWNKAKAYTGCDIKPQKDSRLMFCADNTRVLRAINLAPFSIFDFDAYGSPWVQAVILSDRRRVAAGEKIGLILTEGNGLGYKFNNLPVAISLLTGLRAGMVGMGSRQDDIIDRAIVGLCKRMSCTVEKRWQAARNNTGPSPRYIGLVLKGKG